MHFQNSYRYTIFRRCLLQFLMLEFCTFSQSHATRWNPWLVRACMELTFSIPLFAFRSPRLQSVVNFQAFFFRFFTFHIPAPAPLHKNFIFRNYTFSYERKSSCLLMFDDAKDELLQAGKIANKFVCRAMGWNKLLFQDLLAVCFSFGSDIKKKQGKIGSLVRWDSFLNFLSCFEVLVSGFCITWYFDSPLFSRVFSVDVFCIHKF